MNRELQCLHCMFQFAIARKYITENPATGVKRFDERRERPIKRMLTAEEEQRILDGNVKTKDSAHPVLLTDLASDVLLEWKKEQGSRSPFLFPSPSNPEKPIGTVKRAWETTLNKAGVSYFPVYHLRHVFAHGSVELRPMQSCSMRCGTAARRRNASINSDWRSRFESTSNE